MKAITVNGQIKVFNKIPNQWYRIATPNQLTVGYNTLSNEEHEADGWRDIVDPVGFDPYTERKTAPIYNEADDNYTWETEDLTEDEAIEYVQEQEDKDEDALQLLKYKRDGVKAFDRAMALIMRRQRNGNITGSQAKAFAQGIYPEIEPLYKGLWQVAKANLNIATPPVNEELLDIWNIIVIKINKYIDNNY